jgi:RNA polymerase sigma factor (sigma-70 family)
MRSTVTSINGQRTPDSLNDQDIRTFNDEKLAVLYRETGDERYYAELHSRYRPWLLSFLERYTENRRGMDLEGIANFVFVDLSDYLHSGERLQSIRAWLATRAKHRAFNEICSLNSQKRGNGWKNQGAVEAVPDNKQDNPVRALIREELRESIQAAMKELSPGERAVLNLLYFGGLTCRETADQLGIPEGTVKSRLNHGLKLLRRQLEEVTIRN